MDMERVDTIMNAEAIIAIISLLVMPAILFSAMRWMPSRREFDMHIKQDDERFSDVKASLNRIELHLIGHSRGD